MPPSRPQQPPDAATQTRLNNGIAGRVARWDDQKGYGFIATEQPPLQIFFHISVLAARHRRPQADERVRVKAKYAEGRWTATEVTSPNREGAARQAEQQRGKVLIQPMRDKLRYALPVCGLWLALLFLKLPKLFAAAAVLSVLAFVFYALDKHSALTNRRRVPEANLNLLALLGGWPGALVARYLFRHKTVKQPFVMLFWLAVLANVVWVFYVVFRQPENLSLLWQ